MISRLTSCAGAWRWPWRGCATVPRQRALCPCHANIGYDSADAISKDYKDRGSYPFQNGTIGRVVIRPEGTPELNHAVLLAGALSAD